ncbi:hypothetical protein K2F54_07865 [Cryobacterium sp. 1639]|uniref:hypothetical protein n=1 Tax=Cryobacterium inferilacus TaxID=2866629 RepID=UPI001C73DB94|nr:hypothetical protein [Cryobacterium sp. 1639]MBX0299892.1 hypothetical protein [Cryobacterium sp. 1639]
MRTLASATVLLGVILLSGCTGPEPEPTRSATPTPSATPLTESQQITKQTRTVVNLYSKLVCTNLAEHPDTDLNVAVDKVLATYATEGLSEDARVQVAHNVLEQSAAKDCPDQTERILEGLAIAVETDTTE